MTRQMARCVTGTMLLFAVATYAQADSVTTRSELEDYLNEIALEQLEARRHELLAITTHQQAEARKAEVRDKLISLIGEPGRGVPLRALTTGQSEGNGFYIENVLYDAQPGRRVTANLFIPTHGEGPFPAVILSPGHAPSGKISNYSFAANLARNGMVALAYDIVGEGERLEYYNPATGLSRGERPTGDHSIAAFPSILLNEHVARYFIEDAMQGIDYLVSRKEVDAGRIGAFGCSGGGTITAYLAALDERVQAAATACFVTGFAQLLMTIGPQEAEQSIPNFIASGLDIVDWVELAAPKHYAVVSTKQDMFPFTGAEAAVAEARDFWAIYDAAEHFKWITGEGGHGAIAPLGDEILSFFQHALKVDEKTKPFEVLRPDNPSSLLVTQTGQLMTSTGTVTLADLASQRAEAVRPKVSLSPAQLRRTVIELAKVNTSFDHNPATELLSQTTENNQHFRTYRFLSSRGAMEFQLQQKVDVPNGPVMLVLSAESNADITSNCAGIDAFIQQGWTVIVMQARGMDGSGDAKSEYVGDQNLLSLRAMLVGKTLPGIHIEDTLRMIDWISDTLPNAPITLLGSGVMGPIALQVALLDERIQHVKTEQSVISLRSAVSLPIARELPVNTIAGMLAYYDLPDVINAISPRSVTITAPVDGLGNAINDKAINIVLPANSEVIYNPKPVLGCLMARGH